jgi:hypothetical protein
MVSTVTTSMITGVTTIMASLGVVLGGVAVGALIAMPCARELAIAGEPHRTGHSGQALGEAVMPLVMVFAVTMIANVTSILAS